MHVNAAPIFLRKLQCLCSSKNRIFLFQKPGRSFKGNEEKSIYKAGIISKKSAHTAVISKVDPEYLSAGEAQSA